MSSVPWDTSGTSRTGRGDPWGPAGRASAAATSPRASGTPRPGAGTAACAGRGMPGTGTTFHPIPAQSVRQYDVTFSLVIFLICLSLCVKWIAFGFQGNN